MGDSSVALRGRMGKTEADGHFVYYDRADNDCPEEVTSRAAAT